MIPKSNGIHLCLQKMRLEWIGSVLAEDQVFGSLFWEPFLGPINWALHHHVPLLTFLKSWDFKRELCSKRSSSDPLVNKCANPPKSSS